MDVEEDEQKPLLKTCPRAPVPGQPSLIHGQDDPCDCLPTSLFFLKLSPGTSPVLQWLRLHAPNAGGPGSIPGQGTKIPHAATKILRATTKTRCIMYRNVHCSTISIARTWKQPKCPSTDEWIKKMWHIYTMEY